MDKILYPVEILLGEQSRVYSPEFQTQEQHAAAWKRVLLMSHGKAEVRCCCLGPGTKRLSIHSRANSDRFHLARFPETGSEHSEDCLFYGVDPSMSGLGSYRRGVVQELDDGAVKIKLKVGLQQRAALAPEESDGSAKPETKVPTSRPRSGQASMTLLGLLHFLWTQAGMNTWAPGMEGKRNLGVVHHHLLHVAAMTYAGRVRLSQNLVIATSSGSGQQAGYNKAKCLEAITQRRRLVAVAPLAQHQEGLDGSQTLPIAGFHGLPFMNMDDDVWASLERSFGREIAAWRAGSPIIAVAQTDPPTSSGGSMRARVINIALMQITRNWIPVDSGYEALIAEKLVAEKRKFEKPLRFDAGDEAVFPDFWLRDLSVQTPMEVWGMTSSDYQARKSEKATHYDETYGAGRWWSWNAAVGDPVPDLPQPGQ